MKKIEMSTRFVKMHESMDNTQLPSCHCMLSKLEV